MSRMVRDRATFQAWVAAELADETPRRAKAFAVLDRLAPRFKDWIAGLDEASKDAVWEAFKLCGEHPQIRGAGDNPRKLEAQWVITERYCAENQVG